MKRILIISSAEDQESTTINNDFIAALQKRLQDDCQLEWTNYHGLRVEYGTNRLQVFLRHGNRELRDFDFVYFKSFFRYSEFAGVIATYLEETNTPFVCSELKEHIALTKLTQFARLATAGLPIVDTIFMLSREFRESFGELEAKLGLPFIFKSIDGSGGDENFLIRNQTEFISALDTFPEHQFVAQPFIENNSDYRVLIVGGAIQLVIKRQRSGESTHLNNTSQGADAELFPLDKMRDQDKDMCIQAAKILGRETAGVDLMFEAGTGRPYILEVNASPQIGSGAYTEEKLAIFSDYFKKAVS